MADTTVYFINSTDGDAQKSFSIQPRTFDGYNGIQQHTDLTLYGNAALTWGERFNENFYKLLENFSCAAKESGDYNPYTGLPDYDPNSDPILPKDSNDLGVETGFGALSEFGINNPVQGQLWFNTTASKLYVCSEVVNGIATWVSSGGGVDAGDVTGLQALLDEKVSRSGDTMHSGAVLSFPTLFFNEGNGTTSNGPDIRMAAAGLISADSTLNFNIDGTNSGSGQFRVNKGQYTVDGAETTLFTIENGGTIRSDVTNYEALVTSDNDIPNKKYVDDAITAATGGSPGDYVNVTGDTMSGTLVIDASPASQFPADEALVVKSEGGPAIKMFTTATTQGTSSPPAIQWYNPDNDPLVAGVPADRYPYMRLVPRDGQCFKVELDLDDNGSGTGANTETLLQINQASNNGDMYFNGPPGATRPVIRTPNATIAAIDAAGTKTLTTVEYVDDAIATAISAAGFGYVESGQYVVTTPITWSHGLGGVPVGMTVVARCITANAGFSVGDEIVLASNDGDHPYDTDPSWIRLWMSATQCGLLYEGPAINVIVPNAVSYWRIVFKAWR